MSGRLEVVSVLFGVLLNIVCVVGVILTNKYVFHSLGFNYAITLSTLHFLFTTFAVRSLLLVGLFEYKAAHVQDYAILVAGTLGSVLFMNLNLAFNSVGTYQMSKLATIPVTVALQYLLFKKTVSMRICVSLLLVLVGVAVSQVTELSLRPSGLIYAVLAVVFTSTGQILCGDLQQRLGLDALQLLYHVAPWIAGGMAFLIPVFDNVLGPDGLLDFLFRSLTETWGLPSKGMVAFSFISLTCVLAAGVNISNYLIIGKTTALTYQVVGHFKTILVLGFGMLVFDSQVSGRAVVGAVTALVGVVLYTEFYRREAEAAAGRRD